MKMDQTQPQLSPQPKWIHRYETTVDRYTKRVTYVTHSEQDRPAASRFCDGQTLTQIRGRKEMDNSGEWYVKGEKAFFDANGLHFAKSQPIPKNNIESPS